MSAPISYVTCPGCKGEFYIQRPDFEAYVGAWCHCPFCQRTFDVQEGQPHPPVAAAGSPAAAAG
ncbi:MAG TPA: hypothetical protein VII06_14975 [Chloroflexota bacterium]